jgi:hypothetical protein
MTDGDGGGEGGEGGGDGRFGLRLRIGGGGVTKLVDQAGGQPSDVSGEGDGVSDEGDDENEDGNQNDDRLGERSEVDAEGEGRYPGCTCSCDPCASLACPRYRHDPRNLESDCSGED